MKYECATRNNKYDEFREPGKGLYELMQSEIRNSRKTTNTQMKTMKMERTKL